MLVNIFVYVHHSTVQCEGTGATERLAIFPNLFLHFQSEVFCLFLNIKQLDPLNFIISLFQAST